MTQVVPSDQEQARVLDACVVPTPGQQPYGLARCWNGTHSRSEPGRAISARGWREVTATCAYARRREQTPPPGRAPDQERTRVDIDLAHITRVVQPQALSPLRDVVTDGDDNNQQCLAGVQARGHQQLSTWRRDAPRPR